MAPERRYVSARTIIGRLLAAYRWLPFTSLAAAASVLHLLTLARTPEVFVDEGWYASRAWGLLQTGRNFGPLDAGVWEHFDGYWTFAPWLGTWIQAQAVRLLGLS